MEAKAILFTSLLLENRAVSESIYNTLDITIIANTTKDSGKDEFPLLPGLINKSQPVIHVSGARKLNSLLGLEIDTNDINKEINVIAVKTVVNENIANEIFLLSFLFLFLSAIFGEFKKACTVVITLINKN